MFNTFSGISNYERHDQEMSTSHTGNLQALFTANESVLRIDGQEIAEDLARYVEVDAMLADVAGVLSLILLKPHSTGSPKSESELRSGTMPLHVFAQNGVDRVLIFTMSAEDPAYDITVDA